MKNYLSHTYITYTIGNGLTLVLTMLASLLVARLVEPKMMGVLNGLNLILVYAPFFTLGVFNGLNRELPYFAGQKNSERVLSIASTAHFISRIISIISFTGLAAVGIFFLLKKSYYLGTGFLAFSLITPLFFYRTFIEMTYRTSGEFAKLAKVKVIVSLFGFLTILPILLFKWEGLLLRTFLVAFIGLWLLWTQRTIHSKPAWDRTEFKNLIKIGLPIFFVGYVYGIMANLDRTFILKMLGSEELGYFTPALLLTQAMAVIPTSVNQIIYPKMAEQYGRTNSIKALTSLTFKPLPIMVLIHIPLVIAGWFLIPPVVTMLLPQYVNGIPACQWALIVAAVYSLNTPANLFNIVQRQDIYAIIIIFSGIVMFVFTKYFVGGGYGLKGVIVAKLFSYVTFTILCSCFAYYIIHCEKKQEGAHG